MARSLTPTIDDLSEDEALFSADLALLDDATRALSKAHELGEHPALDQVLAVLRAVLLQTGGCAAVQSRVVELEHAGLFHGTDWAFPEILAPALGSGGLCSANADTVVLEAVSQLRMLAIATGQTTHPKVGEREAHEFVTQVLALNLTLLFTAPSEAERAKHGTLAQLARNLVRYLGDQVGYRSILDRLVAEIWRILRQRPIQTDQVQYMITQIAIYREDPNVDLDTAGPGADQLISSLFGTTQACREDPGVEIYRSRLDAMDASALRYEAAGFARAMHDTGLVSPYHAELVRFLLTSSHDLLSDALGLSGTGQDCLARHQELVHELIDKAVHPQTAQCVYGLALLLDRGVLYQRPVVPALWRQLTLTVSSHARERLTFAYGSTPDPQARLLAGVVSMLGQPLGVGQGDNITCQSARALAMWAYNDPDYLLQNLAWAARDDELIVHFEGHPISSRDGFDLVATPLPIDLDPVSLLMVPHLDRVYAQMVRRCADRSGDPHRWVNPEFHGWWAGRGFRINVDVTTGHVIDVEGFLRQFYASYHPDYTGGRPLIHPQPAGLAVTDSAARFIGWHAIAILRVIPDPQGAMRVYFYNPSNDSGQDWGDGVVVSTAGHGERFGEGSLPFEQFASRLYLYHLDPVEQGDSAGVPAEAIERVTGYLRRSWGADRLLANNH